MTVEKIRSELFSRADTAYADFQSALIPGIEREKLIGVRTPQLRALAKELLKDAKGDEKARGELADFLDTLPHKYFDEMQLHAFIISGIKGFDECM